MKTLSIINRVGESLVGTAIFSPRFTGIQIGRHCPLVRNGEDAEGLLHANFIQTDLPVELNLLATRKVRAALARGATMFGATAPAASSLFYSRPSIGYLPPEVLTEPTAKGIKALSDTGPAGRAVAAIRNGAPDGQFWSQLAQLRLYVPWVRELIAHAQSMGLSLLTPPVPVVSRNLPGAAVLQSRINLSAAAIRATYGGDPAVPNLVYGLHIHPSALTDPVLLRTVLHQFAAVVGTVDNAFYGVHVSFTDLGAVTVRGAPSINVARDLVREVARLASDASMFCWISDTGAVGPAVLDEGPSFTSYHPGLTPRRIYAESAPASLDAQCGKVLQMWSYNLLRRSEISQRAWKVEDTGLFPPLVPVGLRAGPPKHFRVKFGKPTNIGVADRLNTERERELNQAGNARPGRAHVGKSNDARIAPWG